ncbi:hypothetical protein Bca52824_032867 [Brassica carinata]|uniref:Uncharacterized protein n=1 Tax=Brassica carinata TaxID=52824 RepID=A0A8X7V7Y7_BRACI|nr:hypothetical protein Bca52824_032867 [Brassica carinata]
MVTTEGDRSPPSISAKSEFPSKVEDETLQNEHRMNILVSFSVPLLNPSPPFLAAVSHNWASAPSQASMSPSSTTIPIISI